MKSFVISFALIFISCFSFAQTRQYLLAGQSNARGRGDATLAPTVAPMTSLEYHPNLNILFQLEDPVGINTGGFQQAATGSAWPAFAKTYYDMTGDTTVMIPAARGGSGVHPISASSGANWSANGLLYSLCQFKVDQAMLLTGLPLDGIVWVQGEQDAARINFGAYGQDDYRDALIALIDRFRDDYGCALPFYMVLLGANTEDAVEGYDAVRAAQVEVAAIHPHTYLIHENAVNFPGMGWMWDNVHYTQDGYNEIGTEGAQNVVDIERTYYSITQSTSSTDTICPGDSVLLSAPPMYTNYQWSNGDTGQNIFVTAGGEYDVTVTDNTACSFALHSVKIHAYPDQIRPMISLSANDTLCVGDVLTLTASPAGQNYVWSNGATTSSITINTTDDFFVQTIDTNGCLSEPSDTVSTAVVSFTQPNITINGNSIICEGESVILSAPSGFDNYVWSNGETTQSITVTTSGSFNCTVGLADCLSEPSSTLTISVEPLPPAPTISPSGTITFCEGSSVTLTASTELNNYLWSTGETTQSITVSNSGIYSCAFIGDNDCMGPETAITVIEVPLPSTPAVTLTGNTALCQGDEIILTAPGGFVDYQWSTGATTPSITVNSAGTFEVTVIDANGCESSPSAPVTTTINPLPPAPTITTDGPTTFCEGDSVTLSAPIGFMNYQWSNGEATQSITVYDANSYFCVVTDANACVSPISEATVVSEITAPPTPVVSVNGSLTFCEGDSVTLTAPFGFASYQWSNGANTQSITVYDSGTFDVITSSLNNCESPPSESLIVTSISTTTAPAITVNGSTILCEGESVMLTAPPGVSYLWSNGSITQSINVSTPGTYTCVITSADGCESPPSAPIAVEVNPLPSIPTITPDNSTEFCEGENVTLSAPAGFSNYQWSNGENTQTITVTAAGTFEVIVTDANGCISAPSASISTTINPIPTASITALSPTTFCEGDSVVLLAPSGFTNYLWSNGETTQSITITDEGIFDVIVTDAIGCESMPSASITTSTISANIAPVITVNGDTNICAGESVMLSAPAGFSNYLWSNGETTQSITVNTSGDYSCIITGTNDCNSPPSAPINIIINPLPNAPTITSNNSTEFCEGESITLSAPTGFSNYLWSTGETTQSITVTDSGTFDVMVIDANDCESPLSEAITTNVITIPTPSITALSSTTFCEGESVMLSATSGFDNYLWSTGETTQSITVTDSDTFDVMVIDTNGCESMPSAPIMTTAISTVTAPVVTANGNTNICTGENVTLSAPPGSSGYLWSTGETTPNIIVSTPGMYTCIIIAANDCESTPSEAIEITVSPLPPMPIITSGSSNTFCEGESVTLTATAGFDNYLWSTGESTQSITVSTSGTFDVMVIDANGCESPLSEAITISTTTIPAPSITAQSSTTFCNGESVTLTAPAGFDNYLWSTGETTQSITVYNSGTFDVIVVDSDGCESPVSDAITTTVTSITAPMIIASGPTTFCEGESVMLSAPSGFQNYLWSNGEITPSITVTDSGIFDVIITDMNGCISPASESVNVVELSLSEAPEIIIDGSNIICEGESVTLSAPADLAGYLWSTGETTESITVTTAGTFTCEITNTNGCESLPSEPVSITVNPLPDTPVITTNGATSFCEGESVTLSAPSGFSNYEWSTGETTQSITVTNSGNYDVLVINADGCTSLNSQETTVMVNTLPEASQIAASGATTFCNGDSVILSAPSGFQNYEWSTGETTQSITVYNSGTFEYFITDANNCVSANSESLQVLVNDLPTAPAITANGATTFCEGESVTLAAPPGFLSYEWSTGETTQNITVTESGIYDYFVTNGSNCVSDNSNSLEITVHPTPQTPTIAASDVTTFCDGDSVVLSAPNGFQNYEWSTGETTSSITVFESGDYDVFVTNNNGCASLNSQATNVMVNGLPTAPEIITSGATTFCDGDSVILSAPSGFQNYEWSTGETSQNITVYNSGTFEYFLADANGCASTNSAPLDIIVNELPPIPEIVAHGVTEFCEGESVMISAPDGFSNYLWSTGETTQDIVVSAEGSYDVTITNASNCSSASTTSAKVIVNPLPSTPVVQAVGAPIFCEGDSVTLVVPGGFTNYEWSTGETTQSINVSETGAFFCTVTDINGCENVSASFSTVENEALPTPQITFSGETEFCEGESVTLFAPSGYLYLWSNGETTQDITVNETSGPLSCILMDNNGCMSEASDTTFVKVFPVPPVPTIDTLGSTTLCLGNTVELIAPAGFDDYMWSNGATTQSINVGVSGNYSVMVFNEDGCPTESIESVNVTINATPQQPTISINGSTNFCEGESVTLSAPDGAPGYIWSTGETTQSITVSETGSFYCVIVDEFDCQSQESVTVSTTVFGLPDVPMISLSGDAVLCPGDTVILNAEPGFEAYFWSDGSVNEQIIATSDSEYSYFVLDGNGCQSASSDVVAIEVRPLPPMANIHSSNDFNFCEGDSITLQADEGYLSYLWSTGDTVRTITVNSADEFFYTADDGFSCEDAISVSIATGVNPPPPTSEITQIDLELCASEVADRYLWYRNDTLTAFTTRCIAPELSGNWQVVSIVDNCLSGFSTAYEYTGRTPIDPDDPPGMNVFPNPAVDGSVTIQIINIPEDIVVLDIYDVLGRLLYRHRLEVQQLSNYEFVIDTERLSDAVYVAVIDAGFSGRFVQRFVVDD